MEWILYGIIYSSRERKFLWFVSDMLWTRMCFGYGNIYCTHILLFFNHSIKNLIIIIKELIKNPDIVRPLLHYNNIQYLL